MPILGTIASQISGRLASPTSFESIQTVTVGTAQSSIAFTSIPSTYKHLQIRISATAAAPADTAVRFNSDSGSNYSAHLMRGTGSVVQTYPYSSIAQAYVQFNIGFGTTVGVVDILDYTNTNKNTTLKTLAGWVNGATNFEVDEWGGAWYNTAAVTRIDLHCLTSTFSTNSTFALYGIKG